MSVAVLHPLNVLGAAEVIPVLRLTQRVVSAPSFAHGLALGEGPVFFGGRDCGDPERRASYDVDISSEWPASALGGNTTRLKARPRAGKPEENPATNETVNNRTF